MESNEQWRARQRTKIRLKVDCINRAARLAAQFYAAMVEVFKPLVGKQIVKVNGEILAKFDDQVYKVRESFLGVGVNVYRQSMQHSLAWTIRVSAYEGDVNEQHEITVYIGEITQQKLMKITDFIPAKSDHSYDEVIMLLNRRDETEKAYDLAKSACGHFIHYSI